MLLCCYVVTNILLAMTDKLSYNVVRIVVSYIKPYELMKYFVMNDLSREMKFSYDGFDHMFTAYELKEFCKYFPNMVLKGVNVRLVAKDRMKWLRVERLKGYTDCRCVEKNLMGCGALIKSLDLSGCGNLVDLSALRFCRELRSLNLSRCLGLKDLSMLGGLNVNVLEKLELVKCCNLSYDYGMWNGFFGRCGRLRYLDINGYEECGFFGEMFGFEVCGFVICYVVGKCGWFSFVCKVESV